MFFIVKNRKWNQEKPLQNWELRTDFACNVLTTYKFPFAQKPSHGVLFRPNERRRATAKSLTNAAEEFSSITNYVGNMFLDFLSPQPH